jgi:hypothetical protein
MGTKGIRRLRCVATRAVGGRRLKFRLVLSPGEVSEKTTRSAKRIYLVLTHCVGPVALRNRALPTIDGIRRPSLWSAGARREGAPSSGSRPPASGGRPRSANPTRSRRRQAVQPARRGAGPAGGFLPQKPRVFRGASQRRPLGVRMRVGCRRPFNGHLTGKPWPQVRARGGLPRQPRRRGSRRRRCATRGATASCSGTSATRTPWMRPGLLKPPLPLTTC